LPGCRLPCACQACWNAGGARSVAGSPCPGTGGKQHRVSLKTTSKKEARRRGLQIEADLDAGRWQPSPATSTVAEAITAYRDYLRAEERAPKTLNKYDKVFNRLADLAQQRKISDLSGINLKFIDAYRRRRTDEGAQAKTAAQRRSLFASWLTSRCHETCSPTIKGLKLKKPKPTPQPCWTLEQMQQILAASPEDIRPACCCWPRPGCAFGEMSWLSWDDVDTRANILRIQPKVGWKPKTGDQRAVPLTGPSSGYWKRCPDFFVGW